MGAVFIRGTDGGRMLVIILQYCFSRPLNKATLVPAERALHI